MTIGLNKEDAEHQESAMRTILRRLRIKAEVQVVSMEYFAYAEDAIEHEEDPDLQRFLKIGEIITVCSSDALLIVVSLPVPPVKLAPTAYMKWLDALSTGSIAPVLLVRGSNRDVLTASS